MSAMTDKETYSEEETARRREAALKVLLGSPAKPQQPQDYVVLDGAVYAAAVKQRDDRSMVADLYRNDADYRAGKPMERSVKLELA